MIQVEKLSPRLLEIYDRLIADAEGIAPLIEMTPAQARAMITPMAMARYASPAVPDVEIRTKTFASGLQALVHTPRTAVEGRKIIFLHGGGWVFLSPQVYRRLCGLIAARCQAQLIAPYYPQAPEAPYPQALNVLMDLVRSLRQDAPPIVIGDSAGANMALVLALKAPEAIGRLGLSYGVFDDDFSTDSHILNGAGRHPLSSLEMRWFWHQYAAHKDFPNGRPWEARPLRGPLDELKVPAVIATAEHDCLRDDSLALYEMLKSHGKDVALHDWPDLYHGCILHDTFVPEVRPLLNRFLDDVMDHQKGN